MRNNLEKIIRDDIFTFRYYAKHPEKSKDSAASEQLSDNLYVLECRARQAEKELKQLKKRKGPDVIPGLFEKCRELCKKGVLPDENGIIDFFEKNGGLSGTETALLPLIVTCSLIDFAAHSVRPKSKTILKQLANSVISLRKMSETDFEYVTEKLFKPEEVLCKDSTYSSMDEYSKNIYRKRIAYLAFKSGKTETEIAKLAFDKAEKNGGHIGKYLFSSVKKRKRGYVYLAMEVLMPIAVSFCISVFSQSPLAGVLTFFPLWELLRYPIEAASLRNVPAKGILRLSEDSKQVVNAHALITVSVIMPSADKICELENHLEQLYLSNCTGNIKVCCLADFKGAGMPRKPEDKTMTKAAKDAVDRLNRKHGGGFILAVRPRVHSETQNEFIGRERKRGAITELVRAIKGSEKGFSVLHGDTSELGKVKYLIALDADTGLVFDSARELIAVAEHPLNRPVINNGRVTEGFGILVPKTEVGLMKKNSTIFGFLMAGDSGISSYDSATGERYRDLFDESIFCGKGLIDVDTYYSLLDKGLPNESILSHDIIESGYLRTGYVSQAQITEDFPQTVLSYFRRLHRWVRGDWQNIRFIFGKNPLGFISRYKMFDNLRRSATPVLCLAAIIVSLFLDVYVAVCITLCALFALSARNLYSALRSLFHGGLSSLSRRYYSKAMPYGLGCFIRGFADIAFSARESAVCLDAIFKALWRLFVSKKKLLEWTTAAQSEGGSLKTTLLSCIPSMAVSFLLFMLGNPVHRLAGLIILADIPLSVFTSSKIKLKHGKINEKQREKLISYSAAMWGFFEDLCGKENNFLPPDNIQFSPVKATANRTSPTNIGLMLASFLSARDMGFITTAELYMRMNLSLASVEKLEKYEGNLLNWYSTLTLQPLTPRFVSTVDSGNFLCCLTSVKEGLREYIPECPALEEIIDRMEKIISETNLKPLFNERRKLFHIGLDPDTGEKSNSFYDLYMSEARMTAYFAVAKHEVSKKHWGALGRVFVKSGRFTGLASWTGTMFEYFMPNLFVPAPYGSLSREALYFCLHCQKKRAGRLPFGISESGFYAFDRDLNYQYKAHGVKKLALNSRQGTETVISPYSTFLALTEAPSLSLRNLEKLEKAGMNGIYGLYEAADYSRRSGGGLSVVRSYMAHHVGMSMVAVNNIINGSCMQKRFMRDKFMKGAASLLEERIPTDADIYKGIRTEEIPNIREKIHGKNAVSESPNPFYPEAMLLSNGRMTVCITDCGTDVTLCDGMDITVNSNDLFNRPQGIFGVFAAKNEVYPFVSALDRTASAHYKAEFFKDRAEHTAKNGEIRLKMKTTVLQHLDCELREFTVENLSRKNSLDGNLIIYFEPCIEKRDAYSSHPMFSKLFLTDEWDEDNRCILYSRRSSASDNSCGMAAGIIENADETHETSRERVLKSPFGIFSLGAITEFNGGRGNPDCCGAFSIKMNLKSGEKSSFTLAVAVGENKEKALDILLSVRAGKENKKLAANPFFSSSAENSFASKILPRVLAPSLSRGVVECGERCNYKKSDLWSFGISGENPIITVGIESEEETDAVIPYIKINKKLRSCGIKTDLAVIFDGEDKYSLPVTSALKSAAEKEDCGLMIGVGGGIHFIDKTLHGYNEMTALRKSAVFSVRAGENVYSSPKKFFKPLKFIDKSENNNKSKKSNCVKQFDFTEGEIKIKKEVKTLDIPWTMVYANRSFGTMVSDKALGFTWFLNSRENKLTPWYNDLMSDNRGEMLIMKNNGILYDLISLGEAEFTPYSAVWRSNANGIKIIAEVSVASKGSVKKCKVEIKNNSGSSVNFDLMYYVLPVLGVSRDSCGMLHVRKTESGVIAENPFAEIPGFMFLGCNEKSDYICLSQKDFREGNFSSDNSGVIENACLSVGKKISLKNGETEEIEFFISAGVTEKAALTMPSVANFGKMLLNPKKISTNNAELDLFYNSFLYSQVKQSRFFGRTGFYQCSGAYGFRDQLQDCLAFLDSEPELTRTHIARCAAVQFEQGDVLHWWHVLIDKGQIIKGIRTRCSDDLLWLPYACIKYREKTGDTKFWEMKVPYLTGEELEEGENERYFAPRKTAYKESVLAHCIKAVDKAMNFGKNGLPLIGSCDWNDGFSKIGESDAESVWLAMFMIIVLEGMSDVCNENGLNQKGKFYSDTAAELRKTVEEKAWCGDRYARILLENGEPFCEERDFIDILPQAFAVFAGLGKNGRAEIALNTALERLYDGKTVRLLSPPFDEDDKDYIGYIASYPQGIRENGGQYTHAAVWLASALFKIGKDKDAEKLINSINPMSFYADDKTAKRYRAEPYVLAGDVSYGNEIDGRAGWTHFTGSAAWFYRCVTENFADEYVKKKRFTNDKKQ